MVANILRLRALPVYSRDLFLVAGNKRRQDRVLPIRRAFHAAQIGGTAVNWFLTRKKEPPVKSGMMKTVVFTSLLFGSIAWPKVSR